MAKLLALLAAAVVGAILALLIRPVVTEEVGYRRLEGTVTLVSSTGDNFVLDPCCSLVIPSVVGLEGKRVEVWVSEFSESEMVIYVAPLE